MDSEATIPYDIQAGNTASAAAVNENFQSLKAAIDDNYSQLSQMLSAVPDGLSKLNAAPSCQFIKENTPAASSGKFWLDPDGAARSNAFVFRCKSERQ